MSTKYQTTVSKKISFSGKGLHTGKISNISIFPGKVNQGIVLKELILKIIISF